MQSKIPLPTDNIYKFYALFGLFLFITSMYLFVTTYNENRARQEVRFLELSKLEASTELNTEQKSYKALLENQSKIDDANKKTYSNWIVAFFGISIVFTIFGFGMWQFVLQPRLDKIAKLEIEKLEQEVKLLKKPQVGTPLSRLRKKAGIHT